MSYSLYLYDVLFPVPPEKLQIKIKGQNKTVSLISGEEFNQVKPPGLTDFSCKLLLPNQRYPFADYADGYHDAYYFLSLLEKLKTEKRVFSFAMIREGFDRRPAGTDSGEESIVSPDGNGGANTMGSKETERPFSVKNTYLLVTLEDYEVDEESENYPDMAVSIKLKQYVHRGTLILDIRDGEATGEEDRDTSGKEQARAYTVKDGDCLWDIARTQLGDGSRWEELYQANVEAIDAEAVRRGQPKGEIILYTGTVLTIPE